MQKSLQANLPNKGWLECDWQLNKLYLEIYFWLHRKQYVKRWNEWTIYTVYVPKRCNQLCHWRASIIMSMSMLSCGSKIISNKNQVQNWDKRKTGLGIVTVVCFCKPLKRKWHSASEFGIIFLRDGDELRSILSRERVGSVPVRAICWLRTGYFLPGPAVR